MRKAVTFENVFQAWLASQQGFSTQNRITEFHQAVMTDGALGWDHVITWDDNMRVLNVLKGPDASGDTVPVGVRYESLDNALYEAVCRGSFLASWDADLGKILHAWGNTPDHHFERVGQGLLIFYKGEGAVGAIDSESAPSIYKNNTLRAMLFGLMQASSEFSATLESGVLPIIQSDLGGFDGAVIRFNRLREVYERATTSGVRGVYHMAKFFSVELARVILGGSSIYDVPKPE